MNHFLSYSFLNLHFQEAFIVLPAKCWSFKEYKAKELTI